MSAYIGIMLAPFVAVLMLSIARPISLYVQRRIPEGTMKKILYFSWRA